MKSDEPFTASMELSEAVIFWVSKSKFAHLHSLVWSLNVKLSQLKVGSKIHNLAHSSTDTMDFFRDIIDGFELK